MPRRAVKLEFAGEWLREQLARGSRPRDVLIKTSPFNEKMLERAKREYGIESLRRGGTLHWRDPNILEEAQAPTLIAAILQLTAAVERLARSQGAAPTQHINGAPAAPKIVEKGFTLADYESMRWTDQQIEDASNDELYREMQELGIDLKNTEASKDAEGNAEKIEYLTKEIKRLGRAYNSRRTPGNPFDELYEQLKKHKETT